MSAAMDRREAEARPMPRPPKHIRLTEAIDLRQAHNLLGATAFAAHIGYPLNRFTTIHWEAAQISDIRPAIQRFRKLVSDYLEHFHIARNLLGIPFDSGV